MSLFSLPVDRLLAGYHLLLAGLWAIGQPRHASAWPVLAHLAAVGLPAIFDRIVAGAGSSRLTRGLREGYPLVLLLAFWTELGYLLPLLHSTMNDDLVTKLDLTIFGRHWNDSWRVAMPHQWLNQLMNMSYFLYLPLIYVPFVVAATRGRTGAMRDMVFRLLATYLACYLAYLAFPVLGPRATGMSPGLAFDGFFASLSEALRSRGDSLGTAFPSSHAAGAVTVAIIAAQWLRPWAAGLLALQAVGVLLATVYTGNHYPIDAVAGAMLAVAVQLALVPRLLRILTPAPRAAPVPLTPHLGRRLLPITSTGGHQ